MKSQKNLLPLQHLTPNLSLTINENLYKKIQYLCSKIDQVEWSGVLFWKYEGDLQNPETFKINAIDVFPMQKGSQTYTEFEFGPEVVDYMMANDILECKYGLIHSHNNMSTFFSGTDNEELQENAGNHNTYLSLIVNNRMEMCAKLAIKGSIVTTESFMKMTDPDGNEFNVGLQNSTKDVVFTHTCNIIKPSYVVDDVSFAARVEAICTVQPKPAKTATKAAANNQLKLPVQYGTGFNRDNVEKFLITFLGGKKNDSLSDILVDFKYYLNFSPTACIKSAKAKGFKILIDSDECEFIEEVLSILDPYEFNNLEELKNKYNDYLEQDESFTMPKINCNTWNGYGYY